MKPILIVIDMQNDFFRKEGLAIQRQKLSAANNELIVFAREHNIPVIWIVTKYAADFSDATLEMKKYNSLICVEGSHGAEIISEMDFHPADDIVLKKRYSAFYQTGLIERLNQYQPTHLIMSGINTHACVRTTAVDAFQMDFEVILARDCISSYDRAHHEISMNYMDGKIGTALSNPEIFELCK